MLEFIDSAPSLDIGAGSTAIATALAAATCVFLALWTARGLIRRKYARLAETQAVEMLEIPLQAASRTTLPFMLMAATAAGVTVLGLEGRTVSVLHKVFTVAFFWQAGLWISTALVAWLDHRRKVTLEDDKAVAGSIGIIRFVARIAVWAMVLLLTLDNLGVDITGLSKKDLNLIDYDVASCVGTIRCLHTQLRSLRASLAYITNIDGKETAVRVVDVSGSIRGLRKRRSSTANPTLLGEHKS